MSAFSLVVQWTIYVWNENKCVRFFNEGPPNSPIYHFVWRKFHWTVYISPSLYESIQETSPKKLDSLKRKRNHSRKISVTIQKRKFEIGISNNIFAGDLHKILKFAPDFDHDPTVSLSTTLLARSIAEQFDVLPFPDEFEKKRFGFPTLKRGIIPYVLDGQKTSDMSYAFCNISSMTPAFLQTFFVDGIPNLDMANECRDYFITKVYGLYRFALNTTSNFDVESNSILGDKMDQVVEDCLQELCKKRKTHDWPAARARFLKLSKKGLSTRCKICNQLFFEDCMFTLTHILDIVPHHCQ